jgi:hypothetical protein
VPGYAFDSGMKTRIALCFIGSALFPALAGAASPLRLECSAEQTAPGRALVCEYAMLNRLNTQLADLHDKAVAAGRGERIRVKRFLSTRDACGDVECLDALFERGIRETKLALVDVETREPTVMLTSARGVPLRVLRSAPPRTPAAPREHPAVAGGQSALDTAASLLMVGFLVTVLGYTVVARRLAA